MLVDIEQLFDGNSEALPKPRANSPTPGLIVSREQAPKRRG